MIYILAPFVFAFALFALYLIVSLFLKDPARPFRMFAAPRPEEKEPEPGASSQESEEKNSAESS